MHPRNLSFHFIRQLRTISRRTVKPPFLPESLSNHATKNNIEPAEDSTQRSDVVKKEKYKYKYLEDFVLKHPLLTAPNTEDQFQRLAEAVTPLWQVPYSIQLSMKRANFISTLKELRKELILLKAPLAISGKLPCPVEHIIASPDVVKYRNKDEFSIYEGIDGNSKTVGYYVGLPVDPHMRCIPPKPLINIRDSHKLVAQYFQEFIRLSPYKTCLKFHSGGVWRNLIVRSTMKGELMVIVIIYPSLSLEEKEMMKQSLAHYFFRGQGAECGVTSLYLQACQHSKCTREVSPYELVEGESHLVEECLGRSFRVSPDSFFQVNTRAAELLFSTIVRVAEVKPVTTLLDICCGTGTISICLAQHCRSVIGFDVNSAAIEDARVNARENGANNVEFVCGKIEETLPSMIEQLSSRVDVVAVVNPSRAGLHPSAVRALRECHPIKKIVFVTCKPKGNAMHNMAMLGCTLKGSHKIWGRGRPDQPKRSEKHFGNPFVLRYGLPIDLFPHTLHTEHMYLFERYSEPEL